MFSSLLDDEYVNLVAGPDLQRDDDKEEDEEADDDEDPPPSLPDQSWAGDASLGRYWLCLLVFNWFRIFRNMLFAVSLNVKNFTDYFATLHYCNYCIILILKQYFCGLSKHGI